MPWFNVLYLTMMAGVDGITQHNIIEKTGASQSYVSDIIRDFRAAEAVSSEPRKFRRLLTHARYFPDALADAPNRRIPRGEPLPDPKVISAEESREPSSLHPSIPSLYELKHQHIKQETGQALQFLENALDIGSYPLPPPRKQLPNRAVPMHHSSDKHTRVDPQITLKAPEPASNESSEAPDDGSDSDYFPTKSAKEDHRRTVAISRPSASKLPLQRKPLSPPIELPPEARQPSISSASSLEIIEMPPRHHQRSSSRTKHTSRHRHHSHHHSHHHSRKHHKHHKHRKHRKHHKNHKYSKSHDRHHHYHHRHERHRHRSPSPGSQMLIHRSIRDSDHKGRHLMSYTYATHHRVDELPRSGYLYQHGGHHAQHTAFMSMQHASPRRQSPPPSRPTQSYAIYEPSESNDVNTSLQKRHARKITRQTRHEEYQEYEFYTH
ncbi:hypothetical protein BC940DRAFT_27070 [Gongronella butleri]|nr:hypothetical protein BC940DRAFT_27070 [Gongronella butleri]